jgi:hypothetical protein
MNEVPARVRWAARAVLVLLLAYPVVFYTWYLTADRVTATLDRCDTIVPGCPSIGTWTGPDGSPHSGDIIGGHRDTESRTTMPIRVTGSFAVADGPFASLPAILADFVIVGVIGATVMIVRIERRVRRRFDGGG